MQAQDDEAPGTAGLLGISSIAVIRILSALSRPQDLRMVLVALLQDRLRVWEQEQLKQEAGVVESCVLARRAADVWYSIRWMSP